MSQRLLFLILTALLVRLFFVFVFVEYIYPDLYPYVDGDEYYHLSNVFHQGKFLSSQMYYLRLPLYPAMIAFITFIPIDEITILRSWNIGLDMITLILVYLFTRKITNERTGLAAGWLYAFYPLAIYRLGIINTEILQATLLMGIAFSVYLVLRSGGLRDTLLLSLTISFFLFINPAAQLLPFLLAGVFFLRCKWIQAIKLSCILLIPIFLFVVGWGIRNYYVMGSFYLFDARGGKEFWIGNNQTFDGMEVGPHRKAMLKKVREVRSLMQKQMTLEKENDIFFEMAFQEIRSNPYGAVLLFFKKAFRFWYVPASGRMLWATIPTQSFFLFLGLIGFYRMKNTGLVVGIVLTLIGYFWGIYTLVFACIRYSHSVMPLVCVIGGFGTIHILEWTKQKVCIT